MAKKFNFKLILKYSDVFGGTPPPVGQFLEGMGNDFLLKAAAHRLSFRTTEHFLGAPLVF